MFIITINCISFPMDQAISMLLLNRLGLMSLERYSAACASMRTDKLLTMDLASSDKVLAIPLLLWQTFTIVH